MIRLLAAGICSMLLAGAEPAAAQADIEAEGDFVHRSASAVFPEKVGGFRRSAIRQYDAAGDDIGAG